MRRALCPLLMFCIPLPVCRDARSETAELLAKGRWRKQAAETVGEVKDFRPGGTVRLSPYGGWADRRVKATGFFRTERIDGRWWLVDPEGCLFLTVGLCSVNTGTMGEAAMKARFTDETRWAAATGTLLKTHGFNSLGCWSTWRAMRPLPERMPYFPRWNFMQTYKNRREARYGQRGYPNQTLPAFDPAFETFCDEHARQLAATKDDPWLVGHFSDNELPFRPDSLTNYLSLPESDAGHQAAKAWWQRRRHRLGRRDEKVRQADHDAFLEHLARRYYTVVAAAIRKHDPHHLYVGSRIHGRTIREPVFRGSSAVDVVSVNYYHRWSPEAERLAHWTKWSGRPVLISEWYAQSVESPETEISGAGFAVHTDRDRGLFYQNMTLGLLRSAGCVGWHWFKYGGDGKGYHKGVVSGRFEPHAPLLDRMRELNRHVYPLAAFFAGGGR